MAKITRTLLHAAYPQASGTLIETLHAPLDRAGAHYGFTKSNERLVAFLAVVDVATYGLTRLREQGSFWRSPYPTRGLIPFGGRRHYEALSKELYVDLIRYPGLLDKPEIMAEAAGVSWSRAHGNRLVDRGRLGRLFSLLCAREDKQDIRRGWASLERLIPVVQDLIGPVKPFPPEIPGESSIVARMEPDRRQDPLEFIEDDVFLGRDGEGSGSTDNLSDGDVRDSFAAFDVLPTSDRHIFFKTDGIDLGQSKDRLVDILYATNRQRGPDAEPLAFNEERGTSLSYGAARIRVPEAHKLGVIERPSVLKIFSFKLWQSKEDPRKHFVLTGVQPWKEAEFVDMVKTTPGTSALLFVHGFNTTFEEGLLRLGQIVWDLQYSGLPILFSWPSGGKVLDYGYDRNSALYSRQHFIDLLQLLQNQAGVEHLHIIAHSMGNLIVLDALATAGATVKPFAELVMAAPDIDRDHYLSIAARVKAVAKGMTLYASSADRALRVSRQLARVPRAGDVPLGGPIVVPDIETIDVTSVGSEIFGLGHGAFSSSRSVLDDIGRLLEKSDRPPHRRSVQIRGVPEGQNPPQYWRYAD